LVIGQEQENPVDRLERAFGDRFGSKSGFFAEFEPQLASGSDQ
jgi:hypothetical protein